MQGGEYGVEVKRTRSVGIHDEAEGAARYGGRRGFGSRALAPVNLDGRVEGQKEAAWFVQSTEKPDGDIGQN